MQSTDNVIEQLNNYISNVNNKSVSYRDFEVSDVIYEEDDWNEQDKLIDSNK